MTRKKRGYIVYEEKTMKIKIILKDMKKWKTKYNYKIYKEKQWKTKLDLLIKKIWIDWCVSNFSKLRTSEVLYPLLMIFMSIIS